MFRRGIKKFAGKMPADDHWKFLDDYIGDTFKGIATEEELEQPGTFPMPKDLLLTLSCDTEVVYYKEKVKLFLAPSYDGMIGIGPGHPMEVYKIAAGPVELMYSGGKKREMVYSWWISLHT